jgi:hypothetical protein
VGPRSNSRAAFLYFRSNWAGRNLSAEAFDAINYSGMADYKIGILLLNLFFEDADGKPKPLCGSA